MKCFLWTRNYVRSLVLFEWPRSSWELGRTGVSVPSLYVGDGLSRLKHLSQVTELRGGETSRIALSPLCLVHGDFWASLTPPDRNPLWTNCVPVLLCVMQVRKGPCVVQWHGPFGALSGGWERELRKASWPVQRPVWGRTWCFCFCFLMATVLGNQKGRSG